jgi:hypothetical protein
MQFHGSPKQEWLALAATFVIGATCLAGSTNDIGQAGITVVSSPDGLLVTAVEPDSPALAAGIQVGDTVTALDSNPVAGLSAAEFVRQERGPAGSEVTLTIRAKGKDSVATMTLLRKMPAADHGKKQPLRGRSMDPGRFVFGWGINALVVGLILYAVIAYRWPSCRLVTAVDAAGERACGRLTESARLVVSVVLFWMCCAAYPAMVLYMNLALSSFSAVVEGRGDAVSFSSLLALEVLTVLALIGWLAALTHALVFRWRGFGATALKWPTMLSAIGWPLLLVACGMFAAPFYIWCCLWKPLRDERRRPKWRRSSSPPVVQPPAGA